MTAAGGGILRRAAGLRLSLILLAAQLVLPPPSVAQSRLVTLRVGLATDPVTFDPHSMNLGSTTLVNRSLYEALVGRGPTMEKVPQLATSWTRLDPRRWQFVLRQGVHFHDGSLMTAADVIYSVKRAASERSDFQIYTAGIVAVEQVGSMTIEIRTAAPDDVLPDKLTRVFIVSKDWETRHGLADPPRLGSGSGPHANTANGTGPYLLAGTADGRIEMTRFGGWWGQTPGEELGNVSRVIYQTLPVAAARGAALMSGEMDIIVDTPPDLATVLMARPDLKVLSAVENRTIMLGFDQARARLDYSNAPSNPFQDKRVRQAVRLALDTTAIRDGLMNGLSAPAGTIIAPSVFGYSKQIDTPTAPDPNAARQLLRDAGYPAGFSVTLDCPTHRYVSDEAICSAVASMLAKIGIAVNVNVLPSAMWYGKIRRNDTSFFLLGWAAPTFDAEFPLQALLHTPSLTGGPDGAANGGRYSNHEIDTLIDHLGDGGDPESRAAAIDHVLKLARDDEAYVPLHHQVLVWAMKRRVFAVITPEGQLDVKWVKVR